MTGCAIPDNHVKLKCAYEQRLKRRKLRAPVAPRQFSASIKGRLLENE
jgi:hypothetical protein